MEPELISRDKSVGIIGAGPSGCICAKYLLDFGVNNVVLFDKGQFLRTILPTGGGRCNIANAIYDFKELAMNYPRGEKFLYSVFSRFGTQNTLDFFNSIGVKTYTQENDNRIFPVENSSKFVQEKLLNAINCKKVIENIIKIEKKDKIFVYSKTKKYEFDYVVIAIGGHTNFELIKNLGINIIEPLPSLVGLISRTNFSKIAGVTLKNVEITIDKKTYTGGILFTHKGISGPLIYKISSIYARKNFPYTLYLKLLPNIDFQLYLNENPHKQIKNLLSDFVPKSLVELILSQTNITHNLEANKINRELRDKIVNIFSCYPIEIIKPAPDGEVVTCGGVDLKEINPKTMESKNVSGIYFCGEVLDIDGFCGGFNLQNCWSSGYIAAKSIIEKIN